MFLPELSIQSEIVDTIPDEGVLSIRLHKGDFRHFASGRFEKYI
jgi:hypothetical protein